MPDAKKQEYYRQNRDARIRYQKAYYERNRHVIMRRREVADFLDPEQKEALSEYNRAYYAKNKERIKAQRRARAARLKESEQTN